MFESSGISRVSDSTADDVTRPQIEPVTAIVPDNQPCTPRAEKKARGTFELKFLIDDNLTAYIMAWAQEHLGPDPHRDAEFGDGYRVNSLYLDTPEFDVYHRMPGHRRRKFRLRRYGQEPLIYFEQKHKRQGLVVKKRIAVPESEIDLRLHADPDQEWGGHWFRKRVDEHLLKPVCQVIYQRFVRVTSTDEGPLRLTIDSHLKARPFAEWKVPLGDMEGSSLLDGKRILELKFRGAMPPKFRKLIDDYQLQFASFSKYRTSVDDCIPMTNVPGNSLQEPHDA
jgi:hypothetical protein